MLFGLAALAMSGVAAALPTSQVYAEAVEVVRRSYLEPRDLDPHRMLAQAARKLANELHWLQVRVDEDVVVLSHGSGAPIGMVGADSLDALPAALDRLASLVADSGYDLGVVDVRLSVLSGMIEALDRHSRVLSDERLERFETRLSGTQVGIGAFFERSGDHLVVSGLSDRGPAAVAGLMVGDHLERIGDRSAVGMGPSEVGERIRGEAGTAVELVVSRNGAPMAFTLTRAEVVVPNVVWRVLPGSVGYVYIDHISQRTVANLRAALAGLQSVGALEHGLVVDLRGNTGGSMKESAFLADLFVRNGLLLRTAGKDGGPVPNLQAEMYARDDGTEPDVPLVLVVDERSASGSEILAGALMELGRAAVIGSRTYGKGTVQKTYPLTDDVQLKLTVARYILAHGRSIDDRLPGGDVGGIAPDVWMGKVAVQGDDVRFEGWLDARTRADWERRVPEVIVGDEGGDLAVDIARRAVLSVTGTDRALLVEALEAQAAQARREQVTRLASALAPSVDWAPERQPGGVVEADVALRAERVTGGRWVLVAAVSNHGSAPLHRSLIQLSCPTAPYWDGVVIPFGVLPAHAQAVRSVMVEVPPGVEPREDAVNVRIVAEGREVRDAGEMVLPSGSEPLPSLEVVARLRGSGPRHAELTLRNRSTQDLDGVEVQLTGAQLMEDSARLARLPAGGVDVVSVDVESGGSAPLSVRLAVESARFGTLAAWPLTLPADGSAVVLRPPEIEARPAVRASPLGRFVLPIVVLDDGQLRHVVVTANGQKVAWAGPSSSGRVDLAARFPLVAGDNEVVIRATDDQGLVRVLRLGIRGERTPDAVDAGLY